MYANSLMRLLGVWKQTLGELDVLQFANAKLIPFRSLFVPVVCAFDLR
jgi:hypothetical protein